MATKSTTKKVTSKAKGSKKTKEVKEPKVVKAVKAPKVKEVKEPKVVKAVKAPKVKEEVVKEKKKNSFEGEYFYAVGKRKTAVAQIRIYPTKKTKIIKIVNEKEMEKYFPLKRLQDTILSPFLICGKENQFDFSVKVNGGGFNAQADAIRLGISRALLVCDEEGFRKTLRAAGFLTRDARKVERKKPGKKKARKSPQWAKR